MSVYRISVIQSYKIHSLAKHLNNHLVPSIKIPKQSLISEVEAKILRIRNGRTYGRNNYCNSLALFVE